MREPSSWVAFGLVVSLTLVGCGDSGDDRTASTPEITSTTGTGTGPPPSEAAATTSTTAERTIDLTLAGGQVVGGPRKETVRLGDQVRIRATSDVAEVLHVHTFDLKTDLQPGVPGEVVLTATIPGRHEVEFENSGKDALTLEVR
ncbi:MAG: hypothetical protein ACRDY7_17430 [Acidimicrobiia bacterium]